MGDQLLLNGQTREALGPYRASLEGLRQQIAAGDNSVSTLEDASELEQRLVNVFIRTNQRDEALAHATTGLEMAEQLAGADTADVHAPAGVGIARANLADALLLNGSTHEARNQALEAVRLLTAYAASDAASNEPRVTLALVLSIAGEVDWQDANYSAALSRFREAEALFKRTRDADAANIEARLNLAAIRVRMGDALLHTGTLTEAKSVFQLAFDELDAGKLADTSEEGRYALAGVYAGLGAVEAALAKQPGAPASASAHWAAACGFYRLGARAWSALKEPGRASPDGFHTDVPAMLAHDVSHCTGR